MNKWEESREKSITGVNMTINQGFNKFEEPGVNITMLASICRLAYLKLAKRDHQGNRGTHV